MKPSKFCHNAIVSLLSMTSALALLQSSACADSNFERGVKLYAAGDVRSALNCFQAAAKSTSGNVALHYYLALCYQQVGKADSAMAEYEQVVRLAPSTRYAELAATGLKQLNGGGPNISNSSGRSVRPSGRYLRETSDAGAQGDPRDILPQQTSVDYREHSPGDANSYLDITVSINNHRFVGMFDTGASRTSFSKNQLASIGVAVPDRPTDYAIGEGTAAYTRCWIVPVTMRVGDIVRYNYRLEVQESDGDWRSIGTDFFDGYTYSIDRGAHRIFIARKTGGQSPASSAQFSNFGFEVPYKKVRSDLIVTADVNGRPCDFIFDTGGVDVWFSDRQARQLGIKVDQDAPVIPVGPSQTPCRKVIVSRIRLGPIDRRDVEVFVYDEKQASWGTEHPVLGPKFYESYQYTIDSDKGVLRFLRRK